MTPSEILKRQGALSAYLLWPSAPPPEPVYLGYEEEPQPQIPDGIYWSATEDLALLKVAIIDGWVHYPARHGMPPDVRTPYGAYFRSREEAILSIHWLACIEAAESIQDALSEKGHA